MKLGGQTEEGTKRVSGSERMKQWERKSTEAFFFWLAYMGKLAIQISFGKCHFILIMYFILYTTFLQVQKEAQVFFFVNVCVLCWSNQIWMILSKSILYANHNDIFGTKTMEYSVQS